MATNWANMMHPDTVAALESSKTTIHAVEDLLERIDNIRARRPSPSGRVIPEVDGLGRLTGMYIAPGTIQQSRDRHELVNDIMAAINESTDDALRQHHRILTETKPPQPPPLSL